MLPLLRTFARDWTGSQRAFSQRVRSLSPAFFNAWNALPEERRKIAAFFCKLFLAVLLTQMSFQALEEKQIRKWLKKHPPSQKIWHQTLSAYGYHPLVKENQIAWMTQNLSADSENPSVAWTSQPRGLIAFEEGSVLHLYRKNLESLNPALPAAVQWTGLGSGWIAFERAIDFLEAQPLSPAPLVKKKRLGIDPIEVRY